MTRNDIVEWNTVDGNFQNVVLGTTYGEPTGERMTTAIEGETEFEHFHSYCLARDLCRGLDVLDVASGEGYGSSILANVARSVTGVDVDPGAIAHARTTYGGENLRFIQGSALDVVSFDTLEHVREHSRFMRKSCACCAPADGLSSVPPSARFTPRPARPLANFRCSN